MSREVGIVPTGTANTRSVVEALHRLGIEPVPIDSPSRVLSIGRLVLPGVGTFGKAMARLTELDFVDALRERIESNAPTLCICLGMQLLASESEESSGVTGLGVVPSVVRRFRGDVRVPHMGWNEIAVEPSEVLQPGFAYFANSYRLTECPSGWLSATCDYGGTFVAAIQRDAVVACQFHPELSGAYGEALMRRWLAC